MPTISHILFPFDFSQQGTLAAPYVRAIASSYGAKLSVLTVIPQPWNAIPGGMPPSAGLDAPEHELQARQDQALAAEFSGLAPCRMTELGEPALTIVEFALKHHVDLIMMPTHGLTGYRRMLLGSVTAKVLEEARCPVWTAAHAEVQTSAPVPRTMLCAVEDSPGAVELMRWASEFSQRIGAKLSFLHAIPPCSGSAEVQQELVKAAAARLESIKKSAWIEGPLRVLSGEIVAAITEEERQTGADLLVMGRGLLNSPLGRLHTNAYAIIQQSPCPVLNV